MNLGRLAMGAVVAVGFSAVLLDRSVSSAHQPEPARGLGGDNGAAASFYTAHVQPIFQANCYRCHGGLNHRGGLAMETQAGLLKGGHHGPAIVPGHPEQSLLIKLVRHAGPADDPMPMPQNGRLSDADIGTIETWIRSGAAMPPPSVDR